MILTIVYAVALFPIFHLSILQRRLGVYYILGFTPEVLRSLYKKAQVIYFYLYRDRSKDLPHVSYLYTQGSKAACKAKDLYNYKTFGKPQVKEFGVGHPNTIAMFKYCKQHDMDLWAKEN